MCSVLANDKTCRMEIRPMAVAWLAKQLLLVSVHDVNLIMASFVEHDFLPIPFIQDIIFLFWIRFV